MAGSYLLGVFGNLLSVVGVLASIAGCFQGVANDDGTGWFVVVLGVGIALFGGYLSYVSKQTVRTSRDGGER